MTIGSHRPISGCSAIASSLDRENEVEVRELVNLSWLDRPVELDARRAFTHPALILQLRNDTGKIAAIEIDGHVDAVILDQISGLLVRRGLAHDLEIELLFDDF